MEAGGADELSKDSEGFTKCRTHQNKDGITVPDTPVRDSIIVVEDDLGSDPSVSLEAPEEESETSLDKVVTKVGLSVPVTLAAPVHQDQEMTGGLGPSEPVTSTAPVKREQVIVGGGGLSAPVIPRPRETR